VVIVGAEDAALLFDVHGAGPAEVAAGMAERFGLRAAVVPVRQGHSVWRNAFSAVAHAGGATYQTRTYEVEIVDRLGAGDACAAGLIDGLLDGDVQRGLDWGVALGALKHTIPGEWAWATRAEVAALAAGGSLRVQR
jgi:2-dehydro-3-deoxygluconokinase